MTDVVCKRCVYLGGVRFDNVDMAEAIERMDSRIAGHIKGSGSSLLMAANQDILNRIGKYKDITAGILNDASFLTIPDGYSIVYAAKFIKTPLKERVAGPDLMFEFIKHGADKKYRHFFLGAKEGVAERMVNNFKTVVPDLAVAGIYSPPFGDFSDEENAKIIKMVNDSNADVLWVSFGCPKQEWWIAKNIDKLDVPISAGVGAAFDFHSGNVKRAPLFVRRMRLEWLHRLFSEPGRLFKRYFDGGINLIGVIRAERKKRSHKS